MKIFKTLVEGKHCLVKVDATIQQLWFFTTRAACGLGPTQAEEVIRLELAEELRLKLLNSQDDPPKIVFGEFTEIDSKTARSIPQSGCTWYSQASSQAD